MNELKKSTGVTPAADDRAHEERYETGKGCLSLFFVVLVFSILSLAAAILTAL